MLRRTNLLWPCVIILLSVSSCTSDEPDIDKDLKFAINTSPFSLGLSSYKLPGSRDFSQIPSDPKNTLSVSKVHLGELLFHEADFSTVGHFDDFKKTYTCASCHHVKAGFQAGVIQGIGDGGIGFGVRGEGRVVENHLDHSLVDVQPIRTPSALNIAYQKNVLWNGQFGATALNIGTEAAWTRGTPKENNFLGFEGPEIQAIAGLGVHRILVTPEAAKANGYKVYFDEAFSDWPESERYSNVTAGLAIAAYERTLLANEAPFQRWLRGDHGAMTEEQKRGAMVFFGKGQCNSCHNGPSLAKMEFHAIGMKDLDSAKGINVKADNPEHLGRAGFTGISGDLYKFKVPQLYNLKDSPFYGHGGSLTSVMEVIQYKNNAIAQNPNVPQSQLADHFKPLGLTDTEMHELEAFVSRALYDPHLARYVPGRTLSGLCFPNNDYASQHELNCK